MRTPGAGAAVSDSQAARCKLQESVALCSSVSRARFSGDNRTRSACSRLSSDSDNDDSHESAAPRPCQPIPGATITSAMATASEDQHPDILLCRRQDVRRREANEKTTSKTSLLFHNNFTTTRKSRSHSPRPFPLIPVIVTLTACCLFRVTFCQADDIISRNNRSAVPAVISDLSSPPASSVVPPHVKRKEQDESDSDLNAILNGLSAHKKRLPELDRDDDDGEDEEEDEIGSDISAGDVTTHQSSEPSLLSSSSSVSSSSLSPASPMSSTAADSTHAPDNGQISAPSAATTVSGSNNSSNNNNNLSFTRAEYNVSISESAQGRTFATVIPSPVSEADDSSHIVSPYEKMGIRVPVRAIVVKFKIVSGDEKKTFKSESRRVGDFVFLLIRTRSSEGTLNREYQESYSLRVRATITSKADKRFRAKVYCDVHVRVEDANDLSPLFYPTTYNIQVPADTAIDTRVRQVTAFDSDTGLNGEIYYSMDGDELDFAVHPTLGMISVVRPLNRQANQKRQLVIYASDRERGATPIRKSLAANTGSVLAMQSRAVVNVHITPAGTSNEPETDDLEDDSLGDESEEEDDGRVSHKFKVPENSRFATIVGVINETSGSSNPIFKYKLLNYKSRFAIDSKSGILTVKGLIDREEKEEYQLYVTVTDSDSGSTVRQLTVVVTVTDVNDNPPVFRERTYYARVREDLPVGAVIMRMRAVDDDEGLGGKIVYSIRKQTPADSKLQREEDCIYD